MKENHLSIIKYMISSPVCIYNPCPVSWLYSTSVKIQQNDRAYTSKFSCTNQVAVTIRSVILFSFIVQILIVSKSNTPNRYNFPTATTPQTRSISITINPHCVNDNKSGKLCMFPIYDLSSKFHFKSRKNFHSYQKPRIAMTLFILIIIFILLYFAVYYFIL